MISVYDIGNEAFEKNGDVVLEPKSGTVRQIAGGSYELNMEVAKDPEGKWMHLQKEAVVKDVQISEGTHSVILINTCTYGVWPNTLELKVR